jgi:hypothetical protein
VAEGHQEKQDKETVALQRAKLSLIFYPEDEGTRVLPNVGNDLPNYMASHSRRQ